MIMSDQIVTRTFSLYQNKVFISSNNLIWNNALHHYNELRHNGYLVCCICKLKTTIIIIQTNHFVFVLLFFVGCGRLS